MDHREYNECPLKATQDGHRNCIVGTHCCLFLDDKGKPLHECKGHLFCEAWDVITDLERSNENHAYECENLVSEITKLEDKIRELEEENE